MCWNQRNIYTKSLLFGPHLVSSRVILYQEYTPAGTVKACIFWRQLSLENIVTPLPSGQLFLKQDLSVALLSLMALSLQHFRDKPENMEKKETVSLVLEGLLTECLL